MKHVLCLLMGCAAFAQVSYAQHIPESKVPASCVQAFHKLYPQVKNYFWEKEHQNFEANWKEKGYDHSVAFSATGAFAGSETDVPLSQIPQPIRDYAEKHHLNIKEASINEDAQHRKTYELDDAKGMAYIFDVQGKWIKTQKAD
ncbi:putative PepSY-like beta-lactamase-inhibitor [Thermoflavifilum aggregans]|uniref:Putative PepSY-like beta-lactamase-inhibitor n=1 Tax=Thermoflavifilum aggregans TaxID=454188 RepID=A0A2M9CTU1_9BACT|nr:PepSY-like domain-containing protein [Thermoflavifilum aggregans]PJJ75336.1 putative PepSY-like beta-lactamase-inhibitor [Thermoflavifilum aggregans]